MDDEKFIATLDADTREFLADLTEKQRMAAVAILRKQADSAEYRRREEVERDRLRRLPAYIRNEQLALSEATELLLRGLDYDEVERRLFNGIAEDATPRDVIATALRIGVEHLGAGTRALWRAGDQGQSVGEHRGAASAERFRVERDRFGEFMAIQFLSAAGVGLDDVEEVFDE